MSWAVRENDLELFRMNVDGGYTFSMAINVTSALDMDLIAFVCFC